MLQNSVSGLVMPDAITYGKDCTCSTWKFQLNMFQYRVSGAVMPDAITYGQDCTTTQQQL